jgi:hypothetical protein
MYFLQKSKMLSNLQIKDEESTISTEELIGAEIIALTPFRTVNFEKDEPDELNEIEIRLKDGRHLNLSPCSEQFIIVEWADNNISQEDNYV